jgi:DNA-binding transcriptional MerR regulator
MKRRGNRRYYQHHEVLLIRRIRDLLYDQGFTISGARNRLTDMGHSTRAVNEPNGHDGFVETDDIEPIDDDTHHVDAEALHSRAAPDVVAYTAEQVRQELESIRDLLRP